MKRILHYLSQYKWIALLAPLFKMLEATFELLVPLVIKSLVDDGIARSDRGHILSMCLLLALFCFVGFGSAVTAQYFSAKAAIGMAKSMRHDMYAKIQTFQYADLDKIGTSGLIARLTADVARVQNGVNMTLRLLLRSPFIVFGAVFCAFTVDVRCAWIFAVAVPLLLCVVFAVILVTLPLYRKVQKRLERVLAAVRQNLTGARVIRAFCAEDAETEAFDRENEALYALQTFTAKISVLLNPATYLLINIATVLLIYTGALRMDAGLLTGGALLALYDYMSQILVELVKFANYIVTVTRAGASAGRIDDFFREGEPMEVLPETAEPGAPYIAFEHVSFAYPGSGDALCDLSFTVSRGETVGIIGGTGSGKTTLINLLPRFYDATAGRVLVGGRDVRTYAPDELRKKFGVVPQAAMLFSGTLRDNLLWGNPDADDAALLRAAEAAQAADILEVKGSLDAAVAERGKNFSGGQKQRLTIARALVRDPEILILDDSASALDYATDARLRTAIRGLASHPTVFLVSQRTASVMHADRILVLDGGKAVGIGRHDELLESCAVYREIYESQFKRGVKA